MDFEHINPPEYEENSTLSLLKEDKDLNQLLTNEQLKQTKIDTLISYVQEHQEEDCFEETLTDMIIKSFPQLENGRNFSFMLGKKSLSYGIHDIVQCVIYLSKLNDETNREQTVQLRKETYLDHIKKNLTSADSKPPLDQLLGLTSCHTQQELENMKNSISNQHGQHTRQSTQLQMEQLPETPALTTAINTMKRKLLTLISE